MSVSTNRLHLRPMIAESRGERWKRGDGEWQEDSLMGEELWKQTVALLLLTL